MKIDSQIISSVNLQDIILSANFNHAESETTVTQLDQYIEAANICEAVNCDEDICDNICEVICDVVCEAICDEWCDGVCDAICDDWSK